MSSMLGILNTGRTGLAASQTALSVTGNNIANVNTDGYTRQRADLQSLRTGGVTVRHIERLRDEYLTARLQDASTQNSGNSVQEANLKSIEALMTESEDSGLSKNIRDFFNTFQDLSLQPGGTTERQTVRSSAIQVSDALGSLTGQISQVRSQLDQQIGTAVGQINTITGQIAQIDSQITGLSSDTQQNDINTLLDQRDRLISQLATFMPVHVVKDSKGSPTIFAGNQVLVDGVNQNTLITVGDPANSGLGRLEVQAPGGSVRPLGSLTEGSLGGMLKVRDVDARQALSAVDRLAAQLVNSVNLQHRAGTGLDGSTGQDFFNGLKVTSAASLQNKGGAVVSASAIANSSQLGFDDYEIRFSAAGQYDVVDTTSGATLSSNNAYTSGGAISFAGMTLTLSNSTGTPQSGDVFSVNAYNGTAAAMGLAAPVAASTDAIAAGQGATSGDNRNALALAGLLDAKTIGNQTFEGYYEQTRMQISMAAQTASTNSSNAQITQQQIQGLVDATSGVSQDDEAINIIQFQRAYEASSRVIKSIDDMMQSIISLVQ